MRRFRFWINASMRFCSFAGSFRKTALEAILVSAFAIEARLTITDAMAIQFAIDVATERKDDHLSSARA